MRKTLITISLLALAMTAHGQENSPRTAYRREGKTFVQQRARRASAGSSDVATAYLWRDSKGNEYPIYLHVYSRGEKAGRTTCYVLRTSSKTGREYKYYLPDGEAIASEILAQQKED